LRKEYEQWKLKHGKKYGSTFDDEKFEIYKNNFRFIEEHNKLGKSYTLG